LRGCFYWVKQKQAVEQCQAALKQRYRGQNYPLDPAGLLPRLDDDQKQGKEQSQAALKQQYDQRQKHPLSGGRSRSI
jgi:hypothetical protein